MDPLKTAGSTGIPDIAEQKIASPEPAILAASTIQQAALPPDVPNFYLPVRGSAAAGTKLSYLPKILGAAKINFSDAKAKIEHTESGVFITPVTDNAIPVVWEDSQEIDLPATDLEKMPRPGALFGGLPSSAGQSRNYTNWNRDFNNWLYGSRKLELLLSPSLKEASRPGETEQEFRIRLGQFARERRDEAVEQLRKKYASKMVTLQDRLRRAQQAAEKQAEQAKQAKVQTAISIGSTLLGAFTGRKISSTTISRASTAMRGASRAVDESKDVARAGDTVEAIQKQLADLQVEFGAETLALQERIDPGTEVMEAIVVKPNKSDILVQLVTLVWVPHWQDAQGNSTPAW
jgi:hypothetical protein